jgi:hypothetical protein
MCAFAILAGLTGTLTVIYFRAVENGTKALHLRELREAADTVFRRILYEEHKWYDGDEKKFDQTYAEWAGIQKGWERDRWRAYRWVLRKERRTAAGRPDSSKGEESILGTGTSTVGSTQDSTAEADEDAPPGQALWRMTMYVYLSEDTGTAEPKLVLRTFLPVRDDPSSGTTK